MADLDALFDALESAGRSNRSGYVAGLIRDLRAETTRKITAQTERIEHLLDLLDSVENPMTEAEHAFVAHAGELMAMASEIVAVGPSRQGDLEEIAAAIHVLQYKVMGQAAARGFPDRYRLLGSEEIRQAWENGTPAKPTLATHRGSSGEFEQAFAR